MRGRKPQIKTMPPGPLELGEPVRPKCVTGPARKLWDEIVPGLIAAGVVTALDTQALATYCWLLELEQQCVKEIRRDGVTLDTPHGLKRHPSVGVLADTRKQLVRYASEFGKTPLARKRVPAETGSGDSADEKRIARIMGEIPGTDD